MKIRSVTKLLCISGLTILCIGCGGDSSDDGGGSRNVSGTWSGAITKVSDTCSSTTPSIVNFSHSINQNEDAVTLVANGSLTYLGNLVGSNGLSVDATTSTASGCQDENRIEYDSVDEDNDTTAHIDLRIKRTCGSTVCEIAYTGTGTRAGAVPVPTATAVPGTTPTVTPTVVPGTTATPIANAGCAAINPRTVAGTFSGDGGCGISSAAYRFEQQGAEGVAILEPFGANGATSFVVSTANASAATSRRSDLTILSQPGYICTLACSAPSTFTVNCTKEGATSCVEKF